MWPRRPNPAAVARIAAHGTRLVPDLEERTPDLVEPPQISHSTTPSTAATRRPAWRPLALCGHCSHGVYEHGVQYGALVGWHTWAPEKPYVPKTWSEIRSPEGDL